MGINDDKTFNFNISLKQIGIVALACALCFVAIYWNALTIGYIIVTIALCVFFLAVAFDYGVDPRQTNVVEDPNPAAPASGDPAAPRRSSRNARTA